MTYTCPMHPEIVRKEPGTCPICSMSLVPSVKTAQPTPDRGLGPLTWKSYMPLISIITGILLVSMWASISIDGLSSAAVMRTIGYFMAGYFIFFSSFKLIDLKGFAEGYAMYDLLAMRVRAYGYIYPFIELAFGLAMLSGWQRPSVLVAEVIVMLFSGVGVLIKVLRKEKFQCVCLGTWLKVPLTTVTLLEDFGMAFLALLQLLL